MSRIDNLIAQHCPEGVEFKTLGEVGEFVRGSGLQKKDLADDGVPAIHYGQVFTTYGTSTTFTKSFVEPSMAARLRRAKPGNLVVATTSENDADVCKAVAWLGDVEVAVSGDAFIYAHTLDPLYAAYFFQTDAFQSQKRRYISGTKVKRVSGTDLARIKIPVPPLAVQREIAEVLDRIEALEAELEAELGARSRQYAYYRDSLLTFAERDSERVRWATLSDVGMLYSGLTGKSKADFSDGNARFVTYVKVFNKLATDTSPEARVKVVDGERQNRVKFGDILFTSSSESAEEVGMSSGVTAEPPEPLYLNSFCFGFRPNDVAELNPEFAKHLFRAKVMRRQIIRTASGVTRINISKERFRKIEIPIPEAVEQERIAAILDRFEALVNDISIGLPAEIAARRKQFEYYRDRLLTFEEVA